jgi:D-lactate dehydrogenase (quinone)
LTGEGDTRPYRAGYRIGGGAAVAVVRPHTLLELWRAAQICVQHQAIIILQAANTGLTGGSTPCGSYDRPVVVISTLRLDAVVPIEDGKAAICLAGSTLTKLEQAIAPFDRSPHSVIGSSCIGASVVGGICNNSGGALVRRGPAFTRHALFARIGSDGTLELVNHLGRFLGADPEDVLRRLDAGDPGIPEDENGSSSGLPDDYVEHLRQSDGSPARYNADPRRLFEASGCAGKLIVFAVRVPTFPAPRTEQTFLVTTDDPPRLEALRRSILSELAIVPSTCEYMDRNTRDLAARYGRDICHLLAVFGPSAMPKILGAQKWLDGLGERFGLGPSMSARLSQALFRFTPHPLSKKLRKLMDRHEHALIMTTDDEGISPLNALLQRACRDSSIAHTRLDPGQSEAALRLRFASAGATVRIEAMSRQSAILAALDMALPKNAVDWTFVLPERLERMVLAKAAYGHFMCHVFHLDYVLRPGVDREAFELEVKALVEKRGGQMPAEHNFGHLYQAPAAVAEFYRSLDPTNTLNPGIGKTSRAHAWA